MLGGTPDKKTATLYLGRPTSDRLLRIYDRRGFTRLEIQTRNERATALSTLLAAYGASYLPDLTIGALRDFIDFTDHTSNQNPSRQALLSWWEELVTSRPKVPTPIPRPVPTLTRTLSWYAKSVAPSTRAIRTGAGDKATDHLLASLEPDNEPGPRERLLTAEARTLLT